MNFSRWFRSLLPLVLVVMLASTACSAAPSKYDQVQNETTGSNAPASVEKGAEQGGEFNQFFPDSQGEFKVVPSQEKKGFAEYKLKRDGETLAMLTINDTISLPAAAQKYENATVKVGGFPSVEQGNTATGLLVNDRYQVKVLSRSNAFTAADRANWLEKFDLKGLARLEADSKSYRRAQKKQPTQASKAVIDKTKAAASTNSPRSLLEKIPFLAPSPAS